MKTTIMKSVCIAIVMVISGIFTTMSAKNHKFFYEKTYDNDRLASTIKHELSNYGPYVKTLKYEYSYDDSGIMIKKEVFRWNDQDESWTPLYKVSSFYKNEGKSLVSELLVWNKKSKLYDSASERAIYDLDNEGNVINYKLMKKESEIQVTIPVPEISTDRVLLTKN